MDFLGGRGGNMKEGRDVKEMREGGRERSDDQVRGRSVKGMKNSGLCQAGGI